MSRKPTAPTRPHLIADPSTDLDDAPTAPAQAIAVTAPTTTQAPPPTQGIYNVIKGPQEFARIGKENAEAFAAAGKIWAAGVQELTNQFTITAKASFEESMATFKALTSVKSIKQAIELQTAYSKAVVAKALAESSKMTDASLKLTEQAMAPLTARLAATVGAMSKVG